MYVMEVQTCVNSFLDKNIIYMESTVENKYDFGYYN